jgi:hypothetical protein
MSTPRRNLGKLGKELYELVVASKGQLTVSEVAKKTGIRAPLVTHYLVEYATNNGLAHTLPDILMFKVPGTRVTPKSIRRKDSSTFVQISALRLDQAGLTDVNEFKIIPSPRHSAVLLVPAELECQSFEDALRVLGFTRAQGELDLLPETTDQVEEVKPPKQVVTDMTTRVRKNKQTKTNAV